MAVPGQCVHIIKIRCLLCRLLYRVILELLVQLLEIRKDGSLLYICKFHLSFQDLHYLNNQLVMIEHLSELLLELCDDVDFIAGFSTGLG